MWLLYNKTGVTEKAQNSFVKALALEGTNDSSLRGLWNLDLNSGDDELAEEYLVFSLEARPDYFNTIDNQGVQFYYQEIFLAAESNFRKLVELAPPTSSRIQLAWRHPF